MAEPTVGTWNGGKGPCAFVCHFVDTLPSGSYTTRGYGRDPVEARAAWFEWREHLRIRHPSLGFKPWEIV